MDFLKYFMHLVLRQGITEVHLQDLNANTVFYNLTLGIGMLIGRFGVIIPVIGNSRKHGRKKITPLSSGTFRTDNGLFIVLLIGVILIIGGLTFFPALSLGPIVEHLLMNGNCLLIFEVNENKTTEIQSLFTRNIIIAGCKGQSFIKLNPAIAH